MRIVAYLFLLITLIGSNFGTNNIKIGWIQRLPYSYQTNNYNVSELEGLDIDFIRNLSQRLRVSVTLVQINEKDVERAVANQTVDAVLGFSENSLKGMVWSVPYRKEAHVVYLSATSKEYFYTPQQILDYISKDNPLGFSNSRNFNHEKMNKFIEDPKNNRKIALLPSEAELLSRFLDGSLKIFIGDRVVFSTLLHKLNQWRYIKEINLDLKAPISLGILKNSPFAKELSNINLKIEEMRKDGNLDKLFTEYLTPAVLMHTIDEGWLRLIELIGVVAFAIYAFIHGFYRHMALVKTVGFSMVVVFTGPILKDILTTGQIEFFRNPYYISVVIGIVVAAHVIISAISNLSYHHVRASIFSANKDQWIKEVACALGLASYTVSGVLYAITTADTSWFWEGMLGTITATSGLLLAHELYKLPSKIHFLFAELSFGWGALLALYFTFSRSTIEFEQDNIFIAVMIVFFGVFLSRIMALYHQVSSIGFGRKLRETIDNL